MPQELWTSGGAGDSSNGWQTLDGRLDTAWDGVPADKGCWIVFRYAPGIVVSNLVVQFAKGSATNVMALGTVDVRDHKWFTCPVGTPLESPEFLNYLWFIFPAIPGGGVVQPSEIIVNGQ